MRKLAHHFSTARSRDGKIFMVGIGRRIAVPRCQKVLRAPPWRAWQMAIRSSARARRPRVSREGTEALFSARKRPRGHSGSVWILCVGRCSLDIDYETAPGGTASLLVAGARPRKLCRRPCEPRRYHVSSWTRGATTLIGVRRRRQCLSLHVEVLAGSPRCLARANDVSEASASNFSPTRVARDRRHGRPDYSIRGADKENHVFLIRELRNGSS